MKTVSMGKSRGIGKSHVLLKTINRLARKENFRKYMELLIIVKELLFIF